MSDPKIDPEYEAIKLEYKKDKEFQEKFCGRATPFKQRKSILV